MFLFSAFGKKPAATPPPTPTPPLNPVTSSQTSNAAAAARASKRAAALTYLTAPYPSDNTEGIFESLLFLAKDKVDVTGASVDQRSSSGWLGRTWKRVTDNRAAQFLKARQDDFVAAFARQLELNPAEESSVVMVSCHCFIVSNGKLSFGTLYATNGGLYFSSSVPQCATGNSVGKAETASTSSNDSSGADSAAQELEYIKERILFTDVASFLPSIFLPQKDESAPPFIQGVPSAVVTPTALQVFTVRFGTVIQFLGIHDVVVKPPRKTAAEREKSAADAVADAPCTDVLRKQEHALLSELPSALDTLKFCALLWRLWTGRLEELDMPLENPFVVYAEPH